jgi:hypothetical protein
MPSGERRHWPEQHWSSAVQISPSVFSAAFEVWMAPLVRQPPSGRHRLKPSASRAHLNEQQSRSVEHGSNVERHCCSGAQNPDWHSRLQHWLAPWQGSPAARHRGSARHRFVPPSQAPEQHCESVSQASLAVRQAGPLPWHRPAEQVPEQQLMSSAQAPPAGKHPPAPAAHTPPWHRFEQQAWWVEQPLPVSPQAPAREQAPGPPLAPGAQKPLQQSAAAAQATLSARQVYPSVPPHTLPPPVSGWAQTPEQQPAPS